MMLACLGRALNVILAFYNWGLIYGGKFKQNAGFTGKKRREGSGPIQTMNEGGRGIEK